MCLISNSALQTFNCTNKYIKNNIPLQEISKQNLFTKMKTVIVIAIVSTIIAGVCVALPARNNRNIPLSLREYPLKLQPELDVINIDEYLRNERLIDLQIRCVLEKAPCDSVGRWVKPRLAAALMGTCLECTEKQKIAMAKILSHVQEKRQDAYKETLIKYLPSSTTTAKSS